MKPILLFGCGKYGKDALEFFGLDRVEAFVDNDQNKIGRYFYNKPVLTVEQMCEQLDKYTLVIATTAENVIKNQLAMKGVNIDDITCYPYDYPFGYAEIKSILFDFEYDRKEKIGLYGMNLYTEFLISYFSDIGILGNIFCITKCKAKSGDSFFYESIPIVSFDEKDNPPQFIINTENKQDQELQVYCKQRNIIYINLFSYVNYNNYPRHQKIEKVKNKYVGDRCFIIGNGPSLKVEDLEKLYENNIYCFACNKIYKAFDKTNWRPNCYAFLDSLNANDNFDAFESLDLDLKLIEDISHRERHEFPDMVWREKSHCMIEMYGQMRMCNGYALFSEDPSRVIFKGFTVIYWLIQLAAYMGFKEIYLLGMDHKYNVNNYCDQKLIDYNLKDHFLDDYLTKGEKINPPRLDMTTKSFMVAEEYSKKHGFRIYNATRGGHLEVFERVNFDEVLRH